MKFLKPTISKIFISITIFLLSPSVFVSSEMGTNWWKNSDLILLFGGPMQLNEVLRLYSTDSRLLFYDEVFLVIGLFLSYLLACLIIHSKISLKAHN